MKEKNENINLSGLPESAEDKKNDLKGYPVYAANEDIYSKYHEEKDVDPEDISKIKVKNDNNGKNNEKDFNDDVSGSDLDIPGSELDDKLENTGTEDEENSYYSLGGDEHNDLEES